MGWPPLERVGAYAGVAWISFRAFDGRAVEALSVAVAGCAASLRGVLALAFRWAVGSWPAPLHGFLWPVEAGRNGCGMGDALSRLGWEAVGCVWRARSVAAARQR
jgi:hypothetical protein